MVAPQSELPAPKGLRVSRFFLAMMICWAALGELLLPPGNTGPIPQIARMLTQEWHETIVHAERFVP